MLASINLKEKQTILVSSVKVLFHESHLDSFLLLFEWQQLILFNKNLFWNVFDACISDGSILDVRNFVQALEPFGMFSKRSLKRLFDIIPTMCQYLLSTMSVIDLLSSVPIDQNPL